jgi:hypothetical protein
MEEIDTGLLPDGHKPAPIPLPYLLQIQLIEFVKSSVNGSEILPAK